MVETDRPNGVESAEIIFVWNEIAMPGDNVQRRMIQRHCPEQPLKLLHDLRRFVAVLIPCLRRFEVASVGKAIGTDGTKLRQTKGLAIIFARSEEHTSELQSLMRISYAVFCLKKNNKKQSTEDRQ